MNAWLSEFQQRSCAWFVLSTYEGADGAWCVEYGVLADLECEAERASGSSGQARQSDSCLVIRRTTTRNSPLEALMGAIYGFGTTLISQEAFDNLSTQELRRLTARAGTRSIDAGLLGATPFQPIGLGRPLSIEVAYVSTGALSARSLFGGRPDLLVTSAVKRLPVFESAPRAVNLILKDVNKGFRFSDVTATEPGTPLIYYSPALTDRGTAVTVDLVFDRFPEEAYNQVGSLLGSAASIPLFAPASSFAMAGGVLVKLFAQIAEKLVDGQPSFSETLTIDFNRPGREDTQPGFVILTDSAELLAKVEARELKFVAGHGLQNTTTGESYDEQTAHVVLSLDGSDRSDYAAFAPAMASAALLDRFLHTGASRPTGTDLVLRSMKAFNDIHYRSKATDTKREIAEAGEDSEEGKRLKRLFDAYVKNISDKDLRPSL